MNIPNSFEKLKEDRQAAGERYAAALSEIETAYIELHALDQAMQNQLVNRESAMDHRTFRGDLDFFPTEMRHPDFGSYTTEFRRRAREISDPIISKLAG